jgi:hypothetical protein
MTNLFFIIASLFFTFNAFAEGAKLSELQKEAKADNDGKLDLYILSDLNAPHAINPISLSNQSSKSKNEQWKKEKWYRFFVFIPKEHNILAPSQTAIIQWRRKNPSDRVLVMFRYHHGGLYFDMNGDTFVPDAFYHLKYDKNMREQWTEILFNTNWHPDKDKGFMKVWIDGELKIDYKGVANYKKGKELHLKFGIYSSGLNLYRKAFGETKHKKRVIYFDGVKGETTCKKLLNDKKRCEELLITKPLVYKMYKPNNWDGAKSFDILDLRTSREHLNKKSQN